MLHTFVIKGCEILIEGVVLKANLIPLEMWDFDVILGMDWLSTHRDLVDCFTKKVVFWKQRFLELEFEGDRRIFSTYVISALKAKRLLQKGYEAYLAHVFDILTPKVTMGSVPMCKSFWMCFLKTGQDCHRKGN